MPRASFNKEIRSLGIKHSLVSFRGCNPKKLSSKKTLEAIVKAAELMGAKVVERSYTKFSENYFSFALILAQSNLIAHANKLDRSVVVDICTCGNMNQRKCYPFLAKYFEAKTYRVVRF